MAREARLRRTIVLAEFAPLVRRGPKGVRSLEHDIQ